MNHAGGSFAPPLTDEKLESYRSLAMSAPPPIRDSMLSLLSCVNHWWGLPESLHPKTPHPNVFHTKKDGTVTPVMTQPLESAHAESLDPLIPWAHEIEAMKGLFETINPVSQKPLRDAAHHLLWHVVELDKGREPITSDKL